MAQSKSGKSNQGSGPASLSGSATPINRAQGADREILADVRFLTVAEVAGVMRVSKMTVYRMVHAGELPAIRVGRSFRVPEQAVHDYLRAAFIEAG
jgi:excisionase family DNA binding protein